MSRFLDLRRRSPMGRLDARLKMAIGFTISVLVVLVDSLPALGTLAAAGTLVCALAHPNRRQIQLILISSALLAWGTLFSQSLFYARFPRTALFTILEPGGVFPDGLRVYYEGALYGLMQSLRMLAVMLTGYAVCFTTDPSRFLRALTAMRVPFALSFMAVAAIRFIPVVAGEFAAVRTAMRLKGYRPLRNGLAATARTEIASLRPILAGAVRRSEEVALSVLTRGFRFEGRRTSLADERLTRGEWGLLALLGAVLAAVGGCKGLFWMYQHGAYYDAALRGVYDVARRWL